MTGNRQVPIFRKRLAGEPLHGAAPEATVSMRMANKWATAAAKNRMARIKSEARALRAPFYNRPMTTKPGVPTSTEQSFGSIRILSDIRIRPVDKKTLRTTAYDENLERLEWAVRHRDELFPEPAHPIAEEITGISEPAVLTEEPPVGSEPIDWRKVADKIVATPDPKKWSAGLLARLQKLRPPNYPRNRRFRRHLKTSDGRRIHVNVP